MRNNAPVEHCVAEAFILHREVALTMKANITLRAYLTAKVTVLRNQYYAMKNKYWPSLRIPRIYNCEGKGSPII